MPEPVQVQKICLIVASTQNQSMCGAPEKGEKSEVLQVCLKIKINETVVMYFLINLTQCK